MKKTIITIAVIVVLLLIVMLLGPFYILQEGEQSVVTRFGAIVKVETEPGLKFKMPFVDTVVKYSAKILSWDGDAQRIPTKENQFIYVDPTSRWVISDPQKFYETVKTVETAQLRLDDILDSTVRTVISENYLNEKKWKAANSTGNQSNHAPHRAIGREKEIGESRGAR